MTIPRATMRLQFHQDFTFSDAIAILPYLDALNISHVYASPILKARAGSAHGYDVVDPTQINPELGGEQGFCDLVHALRARSLGIIVDIVPNHMAVGGDDNAWWLDLLQNGRESRYAKYFDIDWNVMDGKILAPFLGGPYSETIRRGDVALTLDAARGGFEVEYYQHRFPIRQDDFDDIERRSLAAFDPTSEKGVHHLHELLEKQHYRLAWWKTANDAINWRRFFDINELAALRQDDDDVFAATHGKIFELYARGLIDGVRIDHVDGLSDPGAYCRKLRAGFEALAPRRPQHCPARAYIVVEKILGADEGLPRDWACDGTTGYDFMDEVSRFLHASSGGRSLADFWQAISGRPADFSHEEDVARRDILMRSFSAQFDGLIGALSQGAAGELGSRDVTGPAIRRVMIEILAHLRVYRTYARVGAASPADDHHLSHAVTASLRSCLPADKEVLLWVAAWLGGAEMPGDPQRRADAIRKFQQLSAPLAAKAVEDTAFYRHGALLSRLDVGFDAMRFASDKDAFHRQMKDRLAFFPHGMLATATHDHKRGEDSRARLAVLSEVPEIWQHTLRTWLRDAAPLFTQLEGRATPSAGDAAILFQAVVGAWPLDLVWSDRRGCADYCARLAIWQRKALREAKLRTDWSVPNEAYETAARDFLLAIFQDAWREKIAAFVDRISAAGAAKGLVQTLLKLTCPGVPDLYQGTEFWDFSLVDPDNRRPVDYAARVAALAQANAPADLAQTWRDGRIKQSLIARSLAARRRLPDLFEKGDYAEIDIGGPNGQGVFAFARQFNDAAALIVGARFSRSLLDRDRIGFAAAELAGLELGLPRSFLTGRLENVFTGLPVAISGRTVSGEQLLDRLPVALLVSDSRGD
ncbi:malto-oligosyltrehalose synthase [uncultured Methylovirgula sp.]|uniref:malto-oligosyltrehalose synthase n=1 Tax=uncultured Methylovirgula sp. TaxID=1285960 RepID=UPI002611FB9D|nr:malto-oligosyltrehalose synthase [uncultured Methylovirgula sp.]